METKIEKYNRLIKDELNTLEELNNNKKELERLIKIQRKKTMAKLEAKKRYLLTEYKGLEREYQEYKKFLKEEYPNLAYYVHMCNELEIGPYEEGRYSLEHTSLTTRIKENKEKRKEYSQLLKEIKAEIKKFHII